MRKLGKIGLAKLSEASSASSEEQDEEDEEDDFDDQESNTDDSDFTPEVAVPTCQASARKRHRSRVPVASDDNAAGGISNVAQPSEETITKHYFPPRA